MSRTNSSTDSAVPTRSEPDPCLVDTSVAVPLLLNGHRQHDAVFQVLRGRTRGLAGHAAFESFSVLTRLPAPDRVSPADAVTLLRRSFPATRHLSEQRSAALLDQLAAMGIAGGQVYDALVGATAVEHDLPLVTRDRRAAATYRALGVRLELLD